MSEPTQPEPHEPTDHDDPGFPWSGVISYGIAVLVFGGLAVILVLNASVPTRIGALLTAAVAGYLVSIPVGDVRDWNDADVVDEVDDGLDVLDTGDQSAGDQP